MRKRMLRAQIGERRGEARKPDAPEKSLAFMIKTLLGVSVASTGLLALFCERIPNPPWVATAIKDAKHHRLVCDDSIVDRIRKAPCE